MKKPFECLMYFEPRSGTSPIRVWGPSLIFAETQDGAERAFLLDHAAELDGIDRDKLEVLTRPFV